LYQAKRRYEVGLSGIVNVQQARAAHDQARARTIQARQALTSARQVLRSLTAVPVAETLKGPGDTLPLNPPKPNNVDAWVDTGLQQNAKLNAAKLAARVAAHEVDRQQAVRYPNISVYASHYINDVASNNVFQNQNLTDNVVGIQVSLPIFSGGAIAARSQQAKYQHVSAEAARKQQALLVRSNTVSDFSDVLSGIASVKALRESVKSNAASLHATGEAFKVGSATTLDVLRARDNLLNAQTAYAQARYAYLLSMLQLKQDAGTLGPEDVKAMSEYFTELPKAKEPAAGSSAEG
ncbi:MAG TPA: TolC family protein, partial [Gammaproteobacteria bacterium]|nr:TolC family protein [Gammaproteobacteria bacterium]